MRAEEQAKGSEQRKQAVAEVVELQEAERSAAVREKEQEKTDQEKNKLGVNDTR